jgi:hypothetical protein
MMNLASLIPQLMAQGAPPPGAQGQLGDQVPIVPPGQPLPPSVPNAANGPMPGIPGQSFPEPTSLGRPGGGPAPTPPPGASGSDPVTNVPGQGMPPPGGPPQGPGGMSGPGMMPPPEYMTKTQQDGSVLLAIKNPDGSPGPIVKIVSTPKRGLNRQAEARAMVR